MKTNSQKKVNGTMRVVCYNILNGGTGRLDPIAETLQFLDGDIVGLIEADDEQAVNYLANRLGYHVAIADDPRHSVALLSRYPIQKAINLKVCYDQLDRTVMEAIVLVRDKPLRLLLVHLKAGIRLSSEAKRMAELDVLENDIRPHKIPTVMLGDFNANAPYFPLNPKLARKRTRKRLKEQNNIVPMDIIARLMNLGWTDAYHHLQPDNQKATLSPGFPAQRVDYIFTDATITQWLRHADVEMDGFCPYCSDHYPLWVDLMMD